MILAYTAARAGAVARLRTRAGKGPLDGTTPRTTVGWTVPLLSQRIAELHRAGLVETSPIRPAPRARTAAGRPAVRRARESRGSVGHPMCRIMS